ncbi:DUF349 domain-containing protein [Tersicoccus sp. MR15.9]|uniref:DUF349 domain-containing protein n=1 Tax=Tersicoccus mangrovi TaxID=3121635 RepID=UPI002FE546B0
MTHSQQSDERSVQPAEQSGTENTVVPDPTAAPTDAPDHLVESPAAGDADASGAAPTASTDAETGEPADAPDNGRRENDQPTTFTEDAADADAPAEATPREPERVTEPASEPASAPESGDDRPVDPTADDESDTSSLEHPSAEPGGPAPEDAASRADSADAAPDENASVEPASPATDASAPANEAVTTKAPAAPSAPEPSAAPTPAAAAPHPAAPHPPAPRPGAPRPGAPGVATPKPGAPRPGPRATPHPAPPTPAAVRGPHPETSSLPVIAPPTPSMTPEEAARWGRVDADGTVYLIVEGQEQVAGQYPGAPAEEALAYFVRKFDEVRGKVELLEQRVFAHAPSADMRRTIDHAREQLAERAMVGDVRDLEQRLDVLVEKVTELEGEEKKVHEQARQEAVSAREAIVVEAEELAGKDPSTVQWKASSTRMNELFDAWKSAQKSGVRLPRSAEDGLWKRFRTARTTFDKHRRAFFSQLDDTNATARREKEKLIAEAEALAGSTDWGATAGEYRRLMDRWKASPRASRKDDDALWARFRAAQDTFFSARSQANAAVDAEFSENLKVKEQLLREAQGLLPVTDLAAARKALGSIQERWEAAGKVPRGDMHRMESGMRSVEDAVQKAEREHWRRTDPETKARTNSALSQLESTIASLQDDLTAAESAGDQNRIAQARQALEARQQWLETLQRSAQDFR